MQDRDEHTESKEAAWKAITARREELAELCRIEDGYIVLKPGGPYHIELERCSTPLSIIEWTVHLCDKPWMTLDLLQRFIAVATAHHKIDFGRGC